MGRSGEHEPLRDEHLISSHLRHPEMAEENAYEVDDEALAAQETQMTGIDQVIEQNLPPWLTGMKRWVKRRTLQLVDPRKPDDVVEAVRLVIRQYEDRAEGYRALGKVATNKESIAFRLR